MTIMIGAWAVLVIILATFAHIAIWARTGAQKPRLLSVIGFFVGSAIALGALFVGSGTALPCVPGVTAPRDQFVVLGFNAVQDVRIDIFFNAPIYGSRVCYIPWSDKTANDLVDAQQHKIQLGMEIEGAANGHFHPGEPQTFPLNIDDGMTEKPQSDIQVP